MCTACLQYIDSQATAASTYLYLSHTATTAGCPVVDKNYKTGTANGIMISKKVALPYKYRYHSKSSFLSCPLKKRLEEWMEDRKFSWSEYLRDLNWITDVTSPFLAINWVTHQLSTPGSWIRFLPSGWYPILNWITAAASPHIHVKNRSLNM